MGWDYGTLATEVYELDKPIGHSFGDVEYYARELAGMRGKILEPAVGTGRILIPLLEAGLDVDGLDSSREMLAVCRQHCRDRGLDPVLREADMTAFTQPGAFEAVIIPTGSITLLDGRDATLGALACFRESLAAVRAPDRGRACSAARDRARADALLAARTLSVDAPDHAHRL